MGVEVEGQVDPAFQRLVHDEVQAEEMIKLESLYTPFEQARKRRLQSFGGDLRLDQRIIRRIEDEETDIGAIALVAGAGVSDVAKGNRSFHVSTKRKVG